MSVTEYLEHARACAEIADRLTGDDKTKLMDIAHAWLELAHEEAKYALATDPDGPISQGVKGLKAIRRRQ